MAHKVAGRLEASQHAPDLEVVDMADRIVEEVADKVVEEVGVGML